MAFDSVTSSANSISLPTGLGIGNVVAGAAMASVLLIATACTNPCGNRVLGETTAPGDQKRAVLFERDCGATTGFSTQLSILDRSEALPHSAGNVFIADGDHGRVAMDVHINWESSDHLVVTFPGPARVFLQRTNAKGVRISYQAYAVK